MFDLPDLAYDYAALEPTISAETMRLHHGKHHAKYFKTTNALLAEAGTQGAGSSLEDVVRGAKAAGEVKLFNNAAQAWNHTFFWTCMTPERSTPRGDLAAAVDRAFGGLAGLRKAFVAEGEGHFASGWVWLAADEDAGLQVLSTHDGDNLLDRPGFTPLLVCDLWEHAYYVDYRNDRGGFLEAWFNQVANWDFAADQLSAARGSGHAWRHPEPSTRAAAA